MYTGNLVKRGYKGGRGGEGGNTFASCFEKNQSGCEPLNSENEL